MTNTEIVKGMYEAFNRGDITPVLNSLSDNVEWIIPGGDGIPFAGRYRGRDGVAGFFRKLAETSDTDPIQVDQYVEQGDVVVALGFTTGRSKPLQKQIRSSFAMVFTLRGGKVVKFEEYVDTAAIASAYVSGTQVARS